MVLIKGRASNYAKIEKAIRAAHNYELPEIICVPILRGSKGYLDWIDGESI
jgi:periplasmic divalent cation tolerance protein